MSRPSRNHQIAVERTLAQRIRREMDRRHWSFAMLAQAMKQGGCDTPSSSLQKTVTGWIDSQGQRHFRPIKVNELAALATVFNASYDDLLTDPDAVDQEKVVVALEELSAANQALTQVAQRVLDGYVALFACRAFSSPETAQMIDSGGAYLWRSIADTKVRPQGEDGSTPVEAAAVKHHLQELRVMLLSLAADWTVAEDARLNRQPPPKPTLGSMEWWDRIRESQDDSGEPDWPTCVESS
ncbi:MAG: hypothetical protein LBV00_02395 [Propionibacteriaceae bacterium]|jgi:outer membrane murein-binding lipoprotein Lpp|nr:hypothetical protein [Propionibacteriaceae bacterium]